MIAFLAISDQYATFKFIHKMTSGDHYGWPKITFDHISRHFRSIRNIHFSGKKSQNGRPFWMTENHFRSHFSPFLINAQLFLPNSIGTSLYIRSVATSNMKLIGAFLIQLWSAQAISSYFHKMAAGFDSIMSAQAISSYFHKMAAGGHFGFPIFCKIDRVLPL